MPNFCMISHINLNMSLSWQFIIFSFCRSYIGWYQCKPIELSTVAAIMVRSSGTARGYRRSSPRSFHIRMPVVYPPNSEFQGKHPEKWKWFSSILKHYHWQFSFWLKVEKHLRNISKNQTGAAHQALFSYGRGSGGWRCGYTWASQHIPTHDQHLCNHWNKKIPAKPAHCHDHQT